MKQEINRTTLRITALSMGTDLINTNPNLFKTKEEMAEFVETIYNWLLKDEAGMHQVVSLAERMQ